ncbi:putative synaptic vesicle transporter SV2 [Coleophoma cylindrospora]|uniref:Putative synaptic vesicle transporter SV2 n=1 Tax=Coleophoma cylindrospora TaxID=1849047 RepID=A0A3D8QT78_9HELO|nr:putative synaptic vesicle transporter SV2 [Coleophoma cylindrospora]
MGKEEVPIDTERPASLNDPSIATGEDLLASQDLDPVLNAKMHLVNNTIDEIGWTNYHWKLFVLNGFGYAVDSLLLLLQSIIASAATLEFNAAYPRALTIAVYVGMLVGAIFWGLSADIIGRKIAFNVSLFICSIAVIVAGAAPSWKSLAFFIAMTGFGGGGNLILDTTVFLEYLPSNKQWVLTWLAAWWGLGQAIAGFIAWGFLSPAKWNCASVETCTYDNNKGWRYVMYTSGALVFVMSIARITVIRLKETPKYLLGEGRDAEVVEGFRVMAEKYNRPCSLTVDQLEECGVVATANRKKLAVSEVLIHFRGLFETRTIGFSTVLIWLSWALIGLAYPLFYVFLDSYLASRGAQFGTVSTYDTWRNYALVNICGIPGPMLAGHMADIKWLGRKYTMVIGALITMIFFFAYTQVQTQPQNVGFSCAIAFALNIYYGTLYAYTPEVLPSAHRATGNGVAVACNRIMGILSAVIATVAKTTTSVPIWICAALYAVMAIVAACFPFEPFGKRSS